MLAAVRTFVIIVSAWSIAYSQTGGIQGTVTSVVRNPGGGAPVAGAFIAGAQVHYRRVPAYVPGSRGAAQLAPGEVPFDKQAPADTNGNHAASGLPAGNYVVCATAPGQPLLDPCRWALAPSVSVQNGIVSKLDVQLERGVFLDVRVNDPQNLLPASGNGPFDPPHLIVGVVFGNGAFLSAPRKTTDAKGQLYEIAVPSGTPLQLWLFSRHVTLADAQGKALPVAGAAIPFQAAPGVDQSFTINVTGKLQ